VAQLGADDVQLDELAQQLARQAASLRVTRRAIDGMVRSLWWEGGDAEGFRQQWSATHGPRLASIADRLDDVGRDLRRQAADQRATSAADATSGIAAPMAAFAGPGVVAQPEGPERAEQLRQFNRRVEQQAEVIDAQLDAVRRRLAELRAEPDHDGFFEWLGDRIPGVDSRDESIAREIAALETVERQLVGLRGDSAATGEQRQFLAFSAAPGDHRLVEVIGDLESAERVVIHVPGMNTDLGEYAAGGHGNATNLYRELQAVSAENVVVISFMDYNVPDDVLEAASGRGADSGVAPLQSLVADLHRLGLADEQLAVVAHSYGSVVTGHTMQDGLDVGTVVTVGSPGMSDGADDRSDLGSPDVALWSAAADDDLVAWAPFHGEDPSADGFGANGFDIAGASGHSEYFDRDGRSLTNVARIAAGLPPL
jgi:Alpha/beta hydrolase